MCKALQVHEARTTNMQSRFTLRQIKDGNEVPASAQ